MMKELCPDSMEDIIAGIALYRPGPMQFIGDYIQGKHYPEKVKYLHPLLIPILKTTYGCIVYQEQIMAIFRQLAGYSFGQADIVRRAMGKKDMQMMIVQREIFIYGDMSDKAHPIEGALKRGVPIDTANALFDQMLKFAEYCFNKAHSAAYAYVTYQTAYLKRYYPVEYFAAVLDNRITNLDEIKKHIGFCLAKDITVLPPDINKSGVGFETENGQIRFALAGIKGIGVSGIESIIAERNNHGAFKGLQDFIKRVDSSVLNKRLVENLIKAGAFDSLGDTRLGMLKCYENMMDRESNFKKQRESGQLSLFDMGISGMDNSVKIDNSEEYNLKVKLLYEKEVLGMYITGNPLAEYKDVIKDYTFNTSLITIDETLEDFEKDKIIDSFDNKRVMIFGMLNNVKTLITKKNQTMATARVEDLYGGLEITVFPKTYAANKEKLIEDEVVVVEGRLSLKEEKPKLLVEKIKLWENNADNALQNEIPFTQVVNPYKKLYINLEDENKYDEIANILKSYVGDISVIIVFNKSRKKAPYLVRDTYGLMYELNALLGESNAKFVEKKKKSGE